VGHEDDGERVGVQVFLEPVARFEIEMVRRLVEQQQVRLAEQQLGERDAHLPAAGEMSRYSRGKSAVLNPRPWSTVAVFSSIE